ncbi:hypothetical protein [Pseudovibrio sp. Tun.PSC04-5.I4]|uniref:hypothetical protein n=1 Tax=Pseudovibrio sp. Tun.PSC04-5.I4 TaxID=1798213 RepID=UPI000892146D|nr:hypothetical protein [Pseudovibrio sp. Tun.PSC04-5.I4]SDR26645.1 hypothetical protein SAMN04515695_3930 [Pseudovibrio sp. Tun.PSC04-5.I4]
MITKRKIIRRSRFGTFYMRGLTILILYGLIVALPIKYLPIPGFRTTGELLSGGWSWGSISGCFSYVPVLNFDGTDGYLILEGKRDWQMFENIALKTDANYTYFSATMYTPNKHRKKEPVEIVIKYYDLGKTMHAEGVTVNGHEGESDLFTLVQCGYPSLVNYALRLFNIREYWVEPRK